MSSLRKEQIVTQKNHVVFENSLLATNTLLVKSVCLLWLGKCNDILFIPFQNNVQVKMKGFSGWKEKVNWNFKSPSKELEEVGFISHREFQKLKNLLKLSCFLSIIEENTPQSCSFEAKFNGKKYHIRASFHPTNWGQALSFRIIRSEYFSFPESMSEVFIGKGLTLIGGRTCSGKTTLMYSYLSQFSGHAISLEDPVEFVFPHVLQTNVSEMGYKEGIRSALRQNPDLICIGEIRDSESAQAAVQAALTGHKVIGTIHISSPSELLARMKDLNATFFEQVFSGLIFLENGKASVYTGDVNIKNKELSWI